MPRDNYFGGVATIIKNYLSNRDVFEKYGYDISLFDYFSEKLYKLKNSKWYYHIHAIFQTKALLRRIKGEKDSIIHIHTSRGWLLLKDLFLARAIKKRRGNTIGLTIHFCDLDKILYRNPKIRKLEIQFIKKYIDFLVILSRQTIMEFEQVGVESSKLYLLYTFHNFDVPQMPVKSKDKVNLLFVGSFDQRKGLIDLLSTLLDINLPFHFNICGGYSDVSLKEKIEDYLQKLDGKADILGYVSGEQKKRVFEESDILILPSYGEGLPIVIMEALAAGCVVVSTSVGAIPEIIRKENGALIKPGDTRALKESITNYLRNDKLLRETQNNNFNYGRKFSTSANIRSLCEIYNQL